LIAGGGRKVRRGEGSNAHLEGIVVTRLEGGGNEFHQVIACKRSREIGDKVNLQ